MTALPPRHALDTIGRRSSTRHVVRKVTPITHRGPRNGIPSTSFTHIGTTAPSSQSSRQLREPQINYQGHRNNDAEAQLRSDFELAFDLAAEEFLDNSTTNQATTVGSPADASRRSDVDPQYIHDSSRANDHEEQLEDRAYIIRSKQDEWYNGILDRSRAQEATRRELFQQTKDEWEGVTRAESEAYHRAYEEKLADRRARLAAEAEQRRNALEQERREREQAIAARQAEIAAEEERRRREREQAIAARQAEIDAEEERRRREEEERRQRLRQCAVCLEDQDMLLMIETPCGHWYCRGDIQNAIEVALQSRAPFQCCRTAVPLDNLTGILPEDVHSQYQDLLLELATPNPIYCSNRSCGVFIPPSQARGPDLAECSRCATATCRHCRNGFHPGTECPADVATQQARELAIARGWKACPRCQQLVEKSSGCLHMRCRCGTQFCYGCGGFYPCGRCGVY